jgi:Secretion system C-terminal sorting domain
LNKILNYLTIIVFSSASIIWGNIYLVAENDGDFSKIQSALDIAVAGDTIFVKEKSEPYFEKITFPRSGNANDGHIVLINYPNEKPIIDGNNVSIKNDWPQGLVRIVDKSFIKVIGFEIRNIVVSDDDLFPAGIWLHGALNHVEILNNKIHTIQQTADDAGAHGLAVYGTKSSASISDILIDGNEIYNCKLGWSESLVLNGNVENFIVSNNVVHDNDNIAFDFIGHEGECPNPELDQARNGLVVGNVAYNIDSRGNQAYGDEASAGGFYVDGGKDIIIERNTVYNCNIGIEIACEHDGKSTSGIIVGNNLVMENIVLGIAIGGYDSQRGSTDNCKIINNTLYKNNTEKINWGSEILVQYYCSNNIIENNIIHSKSTIPMISNTTNTGQGNIFNNNIYFTEGSPKWYWGSSSYSNFESYQSGSNQEGNSYYSDPLSVDPRNGYFMLNPNSPAIDNGNTMEPSIHGDLDFYENPRITNDKIDIGAVEFIEITSIKSDETNILNSFKLYPAYPNPFNPTTSIKIELSRNYNSELIYLKIYDMLGRIVDSQIVNKNNSSEFIYKWNAESFNSGLYFAVVSSPKESRSIKLMLVK